MISIFSAIFLFNYHISILQGVISCEIKNNPEDSFEVFFQVIFILFGIAVYKFNIQIRTSTPLTNVTSERIVSA